MKEELQPKRKNALDEDYLILYLIAEDLKGRYFFDGLRAVGLDDMYYQPALASVILTRLGFNPENDDHLDAYCDLADKHSQRVGSNRKRLFHNAMLVLEALRRHQP